MKQIGAYELLEQIQSDAKTALYKGRRQEDGRRVTIKLLFLQNPHSSDIARVQQEYETLKHSEDIKGLARTYDLIPYDGGMAIVREEISAPSLKTFIRHRPMEIGTFLELAMDLADILGRLHKRNIIHRDIRPQNIFFDPETRELHLTNFGISRLITQEHEAIYDPDVIEGTLTYISPEQTGRMNRVVDYRTDLYSLGVTFYEMLTGAPPFGAEDPMELIHAHMATPPRPPRDGSPSIPRVISDIVLKLLEKPAEDRYQNAFGLLHDLQECKKRLDRHGNIEPFALGGSDISLKFTIPHVFVGRKAEKDNLLSAFERCADGGRPEVAMVSGYPGIGKTFLINEVQKPITARKGYFIAAKYDQLGKDVPYSAIIHAFNSLIKQILTESPERITAWRKEIRNALGNTGRIMTDVIPMLALIIGEQPDVPELGPEEARNRFQYVFKNFLRVFTAPEHPLTLFLDDLQWADYASLHFIQNVLTDPDNRALFFIGAYRHNEVEETHMLRSVIESIEQADIPIHHFRINPLNTDNIRDYLASFLRLPPAAAEPLVEVIENKTRGNPFFINQFLKTLHEKGLIAPDQSGNWTWDIEAIRTLEVTDNVIELMAEKITLLPQKTQEALKLAACIGNEFDLKLMPGIMGKSIEAILADLSPALEEGLIYFSGDTGYYLHDRIQEAAYSLIPETKRPGIHYTIGWHLYRNTAAEQLSEEIFQIVNQLDAGKSLAAGEPDRTAAVELARLNAIAGKKAKGAAAYKPAYAYFQIGLSFLSEPAWQNLPELAYELHIQAAEAAYLNGEFAAMEAYLETILANVHTLPDRVRVYEIRIQAFTTQNQLGKAVAATKEILPLLGMELPDPITGEDIMRELARMDETLAGKTDADILGTARMTDPYAQGVLQVITSAAAAFYTGGYVNEIILIVLKTIQLSIEKGIAPQTPFWFSCYAMTLFSMDQMENAFRFADMALELKKRFSFEREVRTDLIVYAFIAHWQRHIKRVFAPLRELYQRGLELGDIEYAHLASAKYTFLRFVAGTELNALKAEIDRYIGSMRTYSMLNTLNYKLALAQTVENLLGDCEDPTRLEGPRFSETAMKSRLKAANDSLTLFLSCHFPMQVAYLFGKTDQALERSKKAKNYLPAATGGMHHIVQFYLYRSLIRLSTISDQEPEQQEKTFAKITYAQNRLRAWAAFAPENLQHKIDLVDAETCRIRGENAEAEVLYESAIDGAGRNGFIHEQALAFELAALFYQARGLERFARLYMNHAAECYRRWGAQAKVAQLFQKHAALLGHGAESGATSDRTGSFAKQGIEKHSLLDVSTVVKTSQAISGEIVLENLLRRLLRIGIENAGAQRGALIFERDGMLYVEAESHVSGDVKLTESVPLAEHGNLPASVIQYVYTTGQSVVLDNAVEDSQFANDPYITQNSIKSVLCAPVEHQKKIVAVFYTENNLTTNAFTPERLEILTILSSQAAISIQNARLFQEVNDAKEEIKAHRDHLEEMVEERTRELQAAQQELIENAHQAGMADIAVGVLHNVGNVLNSVRTSIHTMTELVQSSGGYDGLVRANALLGEKIDQIEDFIVNDPKGKALMQYYLQIGDVLNSDREEMAAELARLDEKTDMITNIIAAQQSYASARSMLEKLDISTIINDALTMQGESLNNLQVDITRDFENTPPVLVEKTKLIHVLINLIRNAKDALQNKPPDDRELVVSLYSQNGTVRVEVRDNGEGIARENLEKIFAHGFTTKPRGHGFGLHTSANYLTEMGGRMWAESQGPGTGSRFILEIPLENRGAEARPPSDPDQNK